MTLCDSTWVTMCVTLHINQALVSRRWRICDGIRIYIQLNKCWGSSAQSPYRLAKFRSKSFYAQIYYCYYIMIRSQKKQLWLTDEKCRTIVYKSGTYPDNLGEQEVSDPTIPESDPVMTKHDRWFPRDGIWAAYVFHVREAHNFGISF